MANRSSNSGSLRFFPYGGFDPFHKESISHSPEIIEHSPPRPPLPSAPPSGGNQHMAPNPYMAGFPPPNPHMNYPMMPPPRPPYPYSPYQGMGGMPQQQNNKSNKNQQGSFPFGQQGGFPFANGGFPGPGQQFPFNQSNANNGGSPFSWGKTFNGINSAMGMMQQLGSIISIFK